jgi:small conductance mechanosensitive channel
MSNVQAQLTNVEEIIKNLAIKSSDLLIDVLVALVVMIIGFRIIAVLEKRLKNPNKFKKLDGNAKGFIISFITIGLKVLLMIIVLSIVGVPMASLVTIVGSCAVAIGLALQGGLSNIAGGLMLLIFKPFKVGDYISSNGYEGFVRTITMFYTTIITVDNKVVQLPNANLSNSNITNFSALEKRRVDINLSVAYDSDIDKVKKIVNGVIEKHEKILKDEPIFVRLTKHDESALVFTLKVWVNTPDYWDVNFDLLENIKKEFDKNHIEIPFNQLDVHMKK